MADETGKGNVLSISANMTSITTAITTYNRKNIKKLQTIYLMLYKRW